MTRNLRINPDSRKQRIDPAMTQLFNLAAAITFVAPRTFVRLAIVASLLSFASLTSCQSEGKRKKLPSHTFRTYSEGDTVYIENRGMESDSRPFTILHEWDVGGESGDDRILAWRIRDIDVDPDGNLFVLENPWQRDSCVYWIGNDGTLQSVWGKGGQGPGDIGDSSSIMTLPSGLLALTSERDIRIFTRTGDLVTIRHTVEGEATRVFSYASTERVIYLEKFDASIVGVYRTGVPIGPVMFQLAMVSENANKAKLLSEFTNPKGIARDRSHSTLIPWYPELQYAALQSGKVFWAIPSEFRYYELDLATGQYHIVQLDTPPIPVHDSDVEAFSEWLSSRFGPNRTMDAGMYRWLRSSVRYPQYKARFDKILANSDGSVWLRKDVGGRVLQFMNIAGDAQYYCFNSSGEFQGVISAPTSLVLVKGDRCYGIGTEDSSGAQIISRYRIQAADAR